MKKFKEWISIRVAKTPDVVVLLGILFANVVLLFTMAFVVYRLNAPAYPDVGYWENIYYTFSMILGTGGESYYIQELSEVNLAVIVICYLTILLGMVIFTGAVIGYITNWVSQFIEEANSGESGLSLSNHIVILNWNTRASEIINEIMYLNRREVIVVLALEDRETIEKEIEERLLKTSENEKINGRPLKNRLTILVRQGETYSTKQLNDICISAAKSIIILSPDSSEESDDETHDDANTIKTLVQTAHLTSAKKLEDQQIVVEVNNERTLSLVNTIIYCKESQDRSRITPIAVNRVLGQIFTQIILMPQINQVYSLLFSNGGPSFFTRDEIKVDEDVFVKEKLQTNNTSIPLTIREDVDGQIHGYYLARNIKDISQSCQTINTSDYTVKINPHFQMEPKHILILGHNSKTSEIMQGFSSYLEEWNDLDNSLFSITVIDDEDYLTTKNSYADYPFITSVIAADLLDKEVICSTINQCLLTYGCNLSIFILSDDAVASEDRDAAALIYLVYVHDIINNWLVDNLDCTSKDIDMIVEILDPKNTDVFTNYSADNIVVSNRYVSKIVTQVSEKKDLFDFYYDILTFDPSGEEKVESKELYIKTVDRFFSELPAPCNATEFIRAVYDASPANNKSVVLGYITKGEKVVLFDDNQDNIRLELSKNDKLILFSNH